MEKKKCINEDGSLNFKQFDLLTEAEQINEQMSWTPEQWWQFYSRDGIWTHEEFCAELDNIIERVYG